jgi:hypothetical protein
VIRRGAGLRRKLFMSNGLWDVVKREIGVSELLTNTDPAFQFPRSPEKSNAGALQFEVCVLQCAEAFIRLIARILYVMKARRTGVQVHLQRIRIGLRHFVLKLRNLLECCELLDGTLQFQGFL